MSEPAPTPVSPTPAAIKKPSSTSVIVHQDICPLIVDKV
jgi:hypothetical protein